MWKKKNRVTGKPNDGTKGFTLLEVLVALAVMSVMMMALFQAYGSNIFITSFTGDLWKAMVFSRNELMAVERSTPPPISVKEGDFEEGHPMFGFQWRLVISDESPFPGVTVRKVVFRLSWKEGGAATRHYETQVYVSTK